MRVHAGVSLLGVFALFEPISSGGPFSKNQLKWNCNGGPLSDAACAPLNKLREKADSALRNVAMRVMKLLSTSKNYFLQFPPPNLPVYDAPFAPKAIIDEMRLEKWETSESTVSYAAEQGGTVTLTLNAVTVKAKALFVCTSDSTRVREKLPGFQLDLPSLTVSIMAPMLMSQTTKGSPPTAEVLDRCEVTIMKSSTPAVFRVREDRVDERDFKEACSVSVSVATTMALSAIRSTICNALEKRLTSALAEESTTPHKPGFWAFTSSARYSVMVVTWNTGALKNPHKVENLRQLFQPSDIPGAVMAPDILVVCLQEVIDINSPYDNLMNALWKEMVPPMRWLQAIYTIMGEAKYSWISIKRQLGVFMLVFVRHERQQEIAAVATGHVNLGATVVEGTYRYPNKAAIGVRLTLAMGISIAFVSAHLAPHDKGWLERDKNFAEVHKKLTMNIKKEKSEIPDGGVVRELVNLVKFSEYIAPEFKPNKVPKMIQALVAQYKPKNRYAAAFGEGPFTLDQSDIVFFAGDLNYRLEASMAECTRKAFQLWLNAGDFDEIMKCDQLSMSMHDNGRFVDTKIFKDKKNPFSGYNEGKIRFAPTFKFELGSLNPVVRFPGYCDRILWKINAADPTFTLSQHVYESVPQLTQSDHTPVHAVFTVTVPPTHMVQTEVDE